MLNLMVEYVTYPLDNGFISNWLVAGPLAIPVDPDSTPAWAHDPGISGAPVERGPLESGVFQAETHTGAWAYQACPVDHLVDHSGRYPTHHYLRSWAYAEIVSNSLQALDLVLTAYGPASVWLAGAAVFQTQDAGGAPATHVFRIQLDQDVTPVLVRFERLAFGDTAHAMALCVSAPDVHVRIPTLIRDIGRRNAFERLTSGVYVERDVYEGDTAIVLRWPAGERAFCPAHVRVHSADDSIYALADASGESGQDCSSGLRCSYRRAHSE